ncbi:MAG TPA: 3-hydroxyacyl-CoA dehydrogenase NAD-binding domain-containing protein [Acidobacteriaceae bacterium]|jgi:3-hydroxybutyryl-CoA dehydrogenase|nr:3-hydroxyacyl-CoA dehydrogenase NAD-binding domain-containing protein [Acidobacteriaceae bacterium]
MESLSLRRIAVIGAGKAGADFALRCARAGFDVVLEDVMPSRLRRAEQAFVAAALSRSPGIPEQAPSAPGPGTLRLALTVEDAVREADLAIDFVPDELESKLEIFCLLDRMAPPHTILCTPSTALSIADLASCTYRADRCFALQLSPSEPTATLIRTVLSNPQAVQAATSWLTALGLTVLTIEDRLSPHLAGAPSPSTP